MWKCWLKSGRYKESSFGGGIYFFKMVLPLLLDGFSSSKSMMTCFKSRVHFPHIWIVEQKLLKSIWNLDLFLNSSWCVIRVLRFLLNNLIEWDAFFFVPSGKLHWFYSPSWSSFCSGSEEAAGWPIQAIRAGHSWAIWAWSCLCCRRVQDAKEAESSSLLIVPCSQIGSQISMHTGIACVRCLNLSGLWKEPEICMIGSRK